jgi:diadenosine tetraphosphatase ApaH/serine/threonine PP2A family protein phosphatase
MATAYLADIHANREAFEAVLRHARAAGATRFVLLGDYVGYGPDPSWCADQVQTMVEDGAVAIRGNHDQALLPGGETGMSALARAAIEWTRQRLDSAQTRFLATLPMRHVEDNMLAVHANAWAPEDWDYITGQRTAERSMDYAQERVTLVGHVHRAALYTGTAGRAALHHHPVPGVPIPLIGSRRWLAVVGAVGQPRDGDPSANYCLMERRNAEITFQRVPYDREATAAKILQRGLPAPLARRIRTGT